MEESHEDVRLLLVRRDVSLKELSHTAHLRLALRLGRRMKKPRGEDRREGEREDNGAADSEGIGVRHWRENYARHARQGKEGQEANADDERRESHRPPHLAGSRTYARKDRCRGVLAEVTKDIF